MTSSIRPLTVIVNCLVFVFVKPDVSAEVAVQVTVKVDVVEAPADSCGGVPVITPAVLIDILVGREPAVTVYAKVSFVSAPVATIVNSLVPLSISWIIPIEQAAVVKVGEAAKSKACYKSADTSPVAVVTLTLYLSFAPALDINVLDGTNVKDVALT